MDPLVNKRHQRSSQDPKQSFHTDAYVVKETLLDKLDMEKPGVRENMDMLRAMRRLNSMPADMKHYVKSSIRKRCSSNAGSKEKGE